MDSPPAGSCRFLPHATRTHASSTRAVGPSGTPVVPLSPHLSAPRATVGILPRGQQSAGCLQTTPYISWVRVKVSLKITQTMLRCMHSKVLVKPMHTDDSLQPCQVQGCYTQTDTHA